MATAELQQRHLGEHHGTVIVAALVPPTIFFLSLYIPYRVGRYVQSKEGCNGSS